MSHDRKYRMTAFQRGLYRHHIHSHRRFDRKHGRIDRLTKVSPDKDDPAKSVTTVVELDRTWPMNLAGITRILRAHTLKNRGEGVTQALRVIAEIDDEGEKGVLAATVDLLYGLVDFRFRYKNWGGAEVSGSRRMSELILTDGQPAALALLRLCELLDADDAYGAHGFHRGFVAEAFHRPEGVGFPKFTKGVGRELIAMVRGAPAATSSGIPEGLQEGAWYAMTCAPFSHEPHDALRVFIGQAYTLRRRFDDWNFREGGITVLAENEGYGRIVPMYEPYLYQPWVTAGRKIFPIEPAMLEAVQGHVQRPFNGTSKLMAVCLKTV